MEALHTSRKVQKLACQGISAEIRLFTSTEGSQLISYWKRHSRHQSQKRETEATPLGEAEWSYPFILHDCDYDNEPRTICEQIFFNLSQTTAVAVSNLHLFLCKQTDVAQSLTYLGVFDSRGRTRRHFTGCKSGFSVKLIATVRLMYFKIWRLIDVHE